MFSKKSSLVSVSVSVPTVAAMPTYEMCLVLRSLPRPALLEGIRRSLEKVLGEGGVVRTMESLGERRLPQRQFCHDEWHNK